MTSRPRWFVLPCVVVLAACTASSPQPQPPSATVTAEAPPAESAAGTGAAASSAAPGQSAAPAGSAAPQDPPQSEITNEPPPGGKVMANASPVTDKSDRMDPMFELVKANRDGFRKCFDLWGKKNPGKTGKIAFRFHLTPDGALEKADMKRDETDVLAAEVENCMIDFAKTLTYPKSGKGMTTVYTHRFEFKASAK